ncbi:MAG: NAD(P)-binding protein [Lachnospiraceae bacterium]|nr:NAD(P)-binding protein [Lachnospiraceae bacterium]
MLRIQNIKLNITHTQEELLAKIARSLKITEKEIKSYTIKKRSIDARKKEEIKYIYCIDVAVASEGKILKKARNVNVSQVQKEQYVFPEKGDTPLKKRPVIVGAGPAGLFCGYMLAESGYHPLIIERGEKVEDRTKTVEKFWNENILCADSNVQFGEGGAGTFSDGKLNTLVKDKNFRNRKVLEVFVQMGADPSILYVNKPHIGTDVLKTVIQNMRNEIIRMGGEFWFQSKLTDIEIQQGKIHSITINDEIKVETDVLVLAIGHSARDTFTLLKEKSITMEQKAFAVGLRMEHPQSMINEAQYGKYAENLGAADYKVTHTAKNGRGVYSFCMCPGGYVVNASSEQQALAVNGMSYHKRDGENANSAIIVTVNPSDFGSEDVLAGVAFQRKLENIAYKLGHGNIPIQLFGDFEVNRESNNLGEVEPMTKGDWSFANLRELFTEEINHSIIEGIHAFDHQISGFHRQDALLLGVESRTSSPIRITRNNDNYLSNIEGIYPCGEGAGYAGGITSAGMDGIRTAEKIAEKYLPD